MGGVVSRRAGGQSLSGVRVWCGEEAAHAVVMIEGIVEVVLVLSKRPPGQHAAGLCQSIIRSSYQEVLQGSFRNRTDGDNKARRGPRRGETNVKVRCGLGPLVIYHDGRSQFLKREVWDKEEEAGNVKPSLGVLAVVFERAGFIWQAALRMDGSTANETGRLFWT